MKTCRRIQKHLKSHAFLYATPPLHLKMATKTCPLLIRSTRHANAENPESKHQKAPQVSIIIVLVLQATPSGQAVLGFQSEMLDPMGPMADQLRFEEPWKVRFFPQVWITGDLKKGGSFTSAVPNRLVLGTSIDSRPTRRSYEKMFEKGSM